MAGSNVIWAEFAGHGYFAGPFTSTVISGVTLISGDVYEVVFLWTNIYAYADILVENVGAKMYAEGYSNRNVPDGYYTITAATTTTCTITGRFPAGAPAAGAPTTSATIRVEDFYKFCNITPDFVTGEIARSRWLPIISNESFSPTLGQKIDSRGGVSSFDGFSLDLLYYQSPLSSSFQITDVEYRRQEAFRRLVRIDPALSIDVSGLPMVVADGSSAFDIDSSDTTIIKRGTDLPDGDFISNSAAFDYLPIMIDREAMVITGNGSAGSSTRTLPVLRGLFDTGSPPDGFAHLRNSIIYDGLQTGQAATCRVRSITDDALTYDTYADYSEIDSLGLVYSGIVENVSLSRNTNTVSLEMSPQIFASQKNSFGDKLAVRGIIEQGIGIDDYVFTCESAYPELPYKWLQISDAVLVRLRPAKDPTASSNRETRPVDRIGAYKSSTYIDNIAWDPGDLDYNDNYIIISPSKDDIEFESKARSYPEIIAGRIGRVFATGEPGETRTVEGEAGGEDAICERDTIDGLYGRDGINDIDVIHVAMHKLEGKQAQPCHVFETTTTGYGARSLTPSTIIYVRLNEVLLQVLTSVNGDLSNGPFDVLPAGLGIGIDQSDIDWASFGWDLANGVFNNALTEVPRYKIAKTLKNVFFTAKDSEKISEWLTDKILQPQNLIISQKSNGSITLSDTVTFTDLGTFSSLTDSDLEFEANSTNFSFSQFYDSSKLFDRILVSTVDPTIRPSEGQYNATVVTPAITIGDDEDGPGVGARIFTFIQAEPLKYDYPFVGGFGSGLSIGDIVFGDTAPFANAYSNILPLIRFVTRSSKFEIGEKFTISLDQAVSADGSRGFTGVGIVIDKKTNILARQSEYEAIVTGELNNLNVWSASAEIAAGSTTTILNLETNRYVSSTGSDIGWEEDEEAFLVSDSIVLYDENFVMLSVDGGGNADPRKIATITPGSPATITIVSPFTDGGGANITPAAGGIIMHGEKSLQTTTTQDFQSWFNDGGEGVFS